MATNVTAYNIPVPDGTDPVNFAGTSGQLAAMATAVGTALDDKQPYDWFMEPTFVSGNFYTTTSSVAAATTQVQSRLNTMPFWVHKTTTFDRIGVYIAGAAAGSTVRLGIYSSNASGVPTTLVLDAGTVPGTAVSTGTITINQSLDPGLYWLATVSQGGTAAVQTFSNDSVPIPGFYQIAGTAIATNQGIANNYILAGVTGALPNPLSGASVSNAAPRVWLRAA